MQISTIIRELFKFNEEILFYNFFSIGNPLFEGSVKLE